VAGQTKKAIDCYRQTLRCDPNLYPVWNQVLILEFEQERWTDLEQDASTCAELFPSYPIPFFFKGYALSRKGAYGAALENFSLAKGVLVNDNALLAEIFMQEGSAYLGLNKQDQAFAAFKEALTISSNGLELSYLHNLLKYKIELVKTTERLQELAAKDPSNPNITFEYAFAQFQAGAYQKALDEMRKISNASLAQTAAYQELLGDIYFHLTQVQDANDSWQKALLYGEGSAVLADKINQKKYVQAP
jgi:tetratricopeptide (TPR) repeat protein